MRYTVCNGKDIWKRKDMLQTTKLDKIYYQMGPNPISRKKISCSIHFWSRNTRFLSWYRGILPVTSCKHLSSLSSPLPHISELSLSLTSIPILIMRLLFPARVVVSTRGAGRPPTEPEGRGHSSAWLAVPVAARTLLSLLCTLRLRVTLGKKKGDV